MSVVFDRPYEFVPRDSGTIWPWLIQRLRLVDRYLVKKEGVVSFEVRNVELLVASTDAGNGVLLAPNHCRYADPLAMGWPARLGKLNFFAMASWHLFNKGWFDGFAMQKCGAFSLNREGTDRKSLETAIEILATAERPLILFAEGMTYRTNDILRPLLDGLSFIARSAARRRSKRGSGGKVVIHPVAIKYLCIDDPTEWAERQLDQLESHLGWKRSLKPKGLVERTVQISDAVFALTESEFLGETNSGSICQRRVSLCERLLSRVEARLGIEPNELNDKSERARTIRTQVASRYFQEQDSVEQKRLQDDARAADIALDAVAYSNSYLQTDDVTDTRVVETIQRLQERLHGKANREIRLKCILEIGDAVDVPATKAPRGETDPVITATADQLSGMLARLAGEARSEINGTLFEGSKS